MDGSSQSAAGREESVIGTGAEAWKKPWAEALGTCDECPLSSTEKSPGVLTATDSEVGVGTAAFWVSNEPQSSAVAVEPILQVVGLAAQRKKSHSSGSFFVKQVN
jgi:hypothetical protein